MDNQHNHPDKLLIIFTIYLIIGTQHKIAIWKVHAHSSVLGHEEADTLANEGALKGPISPVPDIHIAHTILYKLANSPPPSTTNLTS